MPVVYTGGTFDLIHPGHISLLEACFRLSRGDRRARVVVALNPDDFVLRYKGRYPIMPYEDRVDVLSAIRWVDQVVPNLSGEDSRPTILRVRPDIIAIGEDWLDRDYFAQMGFSPDWLEQHGIRLVYVPLLVKRQITLSSTNLRDRVRSA